MSERHRITRPLRRGATTEVLEAVLLGGGVFQRRVAIKRLRGELAGDPAAVKRFEEEALVMSRLHHANIAGVSDYGVEGGVPYLVLELIEGSDLSQLLTRGRPDVASALFIAGEVARALDYAHKRGVGHGAIAAGDVLISRAGDVKLTDFGGADPAGDLGALEKIITVHFPEAAKLISARHASAGELAADCNRALFTLGAKDGRAALAAWFSALEGSIDTAPERSEVITASETPNSPPPPPPPVEAAKDGPDPRIGTIVGEHRVLELLGRGGFGRVYRAQHLVVGAEVALKILAHAADDERRSKRFRREIEVLGKLDHPHIVKVLDAGETDTGLPWFTMELLRGETLRKATARRPFTSARAAAVTRQIAAALSAAHARGFVHRDLAPGNVMLARDARGREQVKVLDFGIARLLFPEGSTRLTTPDAMLGTPKFMAPEQIVNADRAGPAADLYSLGALLVLMLTGAPPFQGTAQEVMDMHLHRPPPELPEAGELGALAQRLMAKDPLRRPADAGEVVAAIDALELRENEDFTPTEIAGRGGTEVIHTADIEGEASSTRPRVRVEVKQRSPAIIGISLAAAALLVAASWWAATKAPEPQKPIEVPRLLDTPRAFAKPAEEEEQTLPPPAPEVSAPARQPKTPRPVRPDPTDRYVAMLVDKGWTENDARELPGYAEWRREKGDAALAKLSEQLQAVSPAELAKRRLDRVLALLERAAARAAIDKDALSALDSRYLALRAALGREPPATVAKNAAKLEGEILLRLRD